MIAVATAGAIHVAQLKTGPGGSAAISPPSDRYSDGIPKEWQGQPVLRWADSLSRRATATDDTPFLIGVWLDVPTGPHLCPMDPGPDPSAPNSWIPRGGCIFNEIVGEAGDATTDESQVVTFQYFEGNRATGPAILRVHVRDPRASECGFQQPICEHMLVVETAVWTGDSFTDPAPYSVADAMEAAYSAVPGTSLEVADLSQGSYDVGLPGAIALSPVTHVVPADMQIAGAYLMPSTEAMHRALPDVLPGASGAVLPGAYRGGESGGGPGYEFWVDHRWLVVANVAFSVNLSPQITTDDEAWLARLEAALKATH
ncbi:MAG TPA: hypothetical protein VIK06_03640 [Candidatus Limnocylindrales bacterium]